MAGPTVPQLEVLALTICETLALFFVSALCVNLIRLFLCDDTLQRLGSIHASLTCLCFNNNNRIKGEDLVPVKCI